MLELRSHTVADKVVERLAEHVGFPHPFWCILILGNQVFYHRLRLLGRAYNRTKVGSDSRLYHVYGFGSCAHLYTVSVRLLYESRLIELHLLRRRHYDAVALALDVIESILNLFVFALDFGKLCDS